MVILAIDSGIERTGYAVFDGRKYLTSALIKTSKNDTTEIRLMKIHDSLKNIYSKYKPEVTVIERLFFVKNQTTAIRVSQAQGVALLLAAQNKTRVEFLTPLQIKQTVTGYGQADKKSVQKMLKLELGIEIKQDDEADAVACGYAYSLVSKF